MHDLLFRLYRGAYCITTLFKFLSNFRNAFHIVPLVCILYWPFFSKYSIASWGWQHPSNEEKREEVSSLSRTKTVKEEAGWLGDDQSRETSTKKAGKFARNQRPKAVLLLFGFFFVLFTKLRGWKLGEVIGIMDLTRPEEEREENARSRFSLDFSWKGTGNNLYKSTGEIDHRMGVEWQ